MKHAPKLAKMHGQLSSPLDVGVALSAEALADRGDYLNMNILSTFFAERLSTKSSLWIRILEE